MPYGVIPKPVEDEAAESPSGEQSLATPPAPEEKKPDASEAEVLSTISIPLDRIPIARTWQIDGEYDVSFHVRQSEMSRTKVSFEILGVVGGPEQEVPEKPEDVAARKPSMAPNPSSPLAPSVKGEMTTSDSESGE